MMRIDNLIDLLPCTPEITLGGLAVRHTERFRFTDKSPESTAAPPPLHALLTTGGGYPEETARKGEENVEQGVFLRVMLYAT